MRKRFYIMLVARNSEGELLKIPIPLHYLYVFIAGALIGMLDGLRERPPRPAAQRAMEATLERAVHALT